MKTPIGFCKTKIALSRQLGIARNTLDSYLSRPGAPTFEAGAGYDVSVVAAFIAQNASNQKTLAAINPTIRELKQYELSLRCARLRFNIERERGLYVLGTDVVAAVDAAGWGCRHALEQKLEREMPSQVAGLDVPDARVLGARLVDEILREWRKVAERWSVRSANQIEPLPTAPADL